MERFAQATSGKVDDSTFWCRCSRHTWNINRVRGTLGSEYRPEICNRRTPVFRDLPWPSSARTRFFLMSHFPEINLSIRSGTTWINDSLSTEVIFNKEHYNQTQLVQELNDTEPSVHRLTYLLFAADSFNKRSPYELICGKEWGEVTWQPLL